MKRSVVRLALAAAGAAVLVPGVPALAEERVWRGTSPAEANCILNGTSVEGTVKVETDAVLEAYGIRVIGNVHAENARKVVLLDRSQIGGSVQIVQGHAARVIRARITGDILFDEQEGALAAKGNRIGGNLQAFQNSGGSTVRNNRIDGNL